MKRLQAIDGLRGIAILGVVMVHASLVMAGKPITLAGWDLGALFVYPGRWGVHLFFILSGLTLTLSLESRLRRGEPYPYLGYAVRRVFRLTPLAWLTIVAVVLSGWHEPLEPFVDRPLDAEGIVLHALYLHGLYPEHVRGLLGTMWSLTPEVVFYVLLPPLLVARGLWQRVALCQALLLVSLFWGQFWTRWYPNDGAHQIWAAIAPWPLLWLFAGGMVAASALKGQRWPVWASNGLAILALVGWFQTRPFWDTMPAVAWLCLLALALAWAGGSSWLARALELAPLRWLGTISYSVFLLHMPIVYLLAPAFAGMDLPPAGLYGAFLGAVLTVTGVASVATYRLVEQPGIRLGEHVLTWLTTHPRITAKKLRVEPERFLTT